MRMTVLKSFANSTRETRARAMLLWIAAMAIAAGLSTILVHGEAVSGEPTRHVVSVIDRADIEMSGFSSLSELLGSRTRFNSFGLYGARFGTGSVNLLVNGRDVSGLDYSTLPIAAVERVEILDQGPVRHGVYGLGSVINIVLRSDYEGTEVSAGAGLPIQKGRDSQHGSALWGGKLGRGHVTIGIAHIGREEVRDSDRDFSKARWTPGGPVADTTGVSISGNTLIAVPQGADPPRAKAFSLGSCDPGVYTGVLTHPAGEVCGYPYAQIAWIDGYQQFTRESLFLTTEHPLGDDSDVYVEARVAQGDSLFVYAPPVGTFDFDAMGSVMQNLIDNAEGLDSNNFPADGEVTVRHRFVGHGNREWRDDVEEYELTLGVEGELDDGLGYDMHVEHYHHKTVETGINLVSESLARAEIESGNYDIANPLSPDDPARHRQAIRDIALRLTHDTETEFMRASATLEDTAFTISGGEVRWTVGIEAEDREWRNIYDYRDSRNRFHEVADVLGSGGVSIAGDRRRVSALAEVSLPLVAGWDLALGARRDDYDDVGEAVSLRAATRYRLNDNLAFRASWSTAARPPGLADLHSPEARGFPRVCDPLNKDDNGVPVCGQEDMLTAGNPDLKPDEAERVSVGATANFGAFSFAADWFAVEITDGPAIVGAQTVVDRAAAGNPVPGTSVEREGGIISQIVNPVVQAGETVTEGVALQARGAWETAWADLTLDVYATRTTHDEYRVLGVEQPGDFPRDRIHAVLRSSWGDVTASWNVHAKSGYWNVARTGRYKAWQGHDLTIQWRDALGIGLDITGGVLNVANRGPSIDPSGEQNPDLSLDSVRGRTLFLNATMAW